MLLVTSRQAALALFSLKKRTVAMMKINMVIEDFWKNLLREYESEENCFWDSSNRYEYISKDSAIDFMDNLAIENNISSFGFDESFGKLKFFFDIKTGCETGYEIEIVMKPHEKECYYIQLYLYLVYEKSKLCICEKSGLLLDIINQFISNFQKNTLRFYSELRSYRKKVHKIQMLNELNSKNIENFLKDNFKDTPVTWDIKCFDTGRTFSLKLYYEHDCIFDDFITDKNYEYKINRIHI